jgi:DNA-binding NarL/FixJ family response regulator
VKPIRVMLVDDHAIVRQGLRSILEPDPRFQVVAEAGNGVTALELIKAVQPDVVLLDLQLPDVGGADLCRMIRGASPQVAVLILSAYADRDLVAACLRAGARGYLLKDAENLALRDQIVIVSRGHTALDPLAADLLADLVVQGGSAAELLSTREMDVLRLMALGLTNREIAGKLFISENTTKGHVKVILSKLGVRGRLEAVMVARQRHLL